MREPFHFSKPRKRLPVPVVTPRQVQFLNALVCGITPREMAVTFKCSYQNVQAILRDAQNRNGLRTREQLAAWWAVRQILERETIAA